MMSEEIRFELWRLPWWKNPTYVIALGALFLCLFFTLGYLIVRWRRLHNRPKTVRERLLLRLYSLRERSQRDGGMQVYCYTELMRIIREFVDAYFGVVNAALTDEEFMVVLNSWTAPELPPEFIALADIICDEACQVKFAAGLVPDESMLQRLDQLIACVESYHKAGEIQARG